MLLSKTNIVSFINASFSSNLLSSVKNTPSCWILWNLSICRETIYCSENQFSHSCSFDRLVFWQTIIQPPHCENKYNLLSLSNFAAIQQQCSSVIQGPYKNHKKSWLSCVDSLIPSLNLIILKDLHLAVLTKSPE